MNSAWRFWLPFFGLFLFAGCPAVRVVRTHLNLDDGTRVEAPRYDYEKILHPVRGGVYDCRGKPLVKATPTWEYRLDPVALREAKVRAKGQKEPRSPKAIAMTIAGALHLNPSNVCAMCENLGNRYQFLGVSDDARAHRILTNTHAVAGIIVRDSYERRYFEGRRFAHVLGSVNAENDGSAGVEQRFNRDLRGLPGVERGKQDGRRRALLDKQVELTPAVPGANIYLTVDRRVQEEAETALADGIATYGAAAGWCVILDVRTGEVLALASHPDFDPLEYGKIPTDLPIVSDPRVNRVTSFTYEPGSVMKVITAASAIDARFVTPDSIYSTDRHEDGYYKLPGDGGHVWGPMMTVRHAIVHSSNIVIGKLGYAFGPLRLYAYMRKFGFGQKTGIELPGEEVGILRDPNVRMWDKATWSRAAIGQGVSVTALQMASAYQAIANDGVRISPRIVRKVENASGEDILDPSLRADPEGVRVIRPETARQVREMMLGVTAKGGTALRARVPGYSVAGKTGTAQKVKNGKYAPGLYRATFCGIVPSGVVKADPADAAPAEARVVILVSLDFEEKTRYHQGGNSAGPIFRRIALGTMRCLEVAPDRPDEVSDLEDDDFDKLMLLRTKKAAEADPEWDGEDEEWLKSHR